MVPDIYCDLINLEIMKMDRALIPILNVTKWSSTGAMEILLGITKSFDYSEGFIKTV
jgi:hypothetical protein